MTQPPSKPEKSLAGQQLVRPQTQDQADTHDRKVRALVLTMLSLFVFSVVISLSAFAYVFVLASHAKTDEDSTRTALCAIIAQSVTGANLTTAQLQRLATDNKLFRCDISPSTVRKPVKS